MIIRKIKPRLQAFSLIELSIVILIISIIASGALSVSRTVVRNTAYKVTRDRMEVINNALTNFVAANKRLPCPASLTVANTTAGFGAEAATPGTCTLSGVTTSTSGTAPVNTNLVYGMVPTTALGLASDMAADGFGTKFSYMVDRRFTLATATPAAASGFEYTAGTPQQAFLIGSIGTLISIRNNSTIGTEVTPIALYAVISHGANKAGGYNLTGTTQNTVSGGTDEASNTLVSAATRTTLIVANSTTTTFDDVISYKTKDQLMHDGGLQFVICSSTESALANVTVGPHTVIWANSVASGNTSTATTGCGCTSGCTNVTRLCGQYGMWSSSYGGAGCTT